MSRPNSELLPVLCVPIDPRQCVGPSLGPTFPILPNSAVQAMNGAGHMVTRVVTGRSKAENVEYNKLVRVAHEIDTMAKTRFDPGRMNTLLREERLDLNRFANQRALRKNEPIPLWAMQAGQLPPTQWQPPPQQWSMPQQPQWSPPQHNPALPQAPYAVPPPTARHAWDSRFTHPTTDPNARPEFQIQPLPLRM